MTHTTTYPYNLLDSGKLTGPLKVRNQRLSGYDDFMAAPTGRWHVNLDRPFMEVLHGSDRVTDGMLMPPKTVATLRNLGILR